MHTEEIFMRRCFQLAKKGEGLVAPNPMVGAVLVHNDRIIAEGYHQKYGEEHAEVNCINNVPETLHHLIAESTLYVSLEPCNHFGKTPPCTDLIIHKRIRKVVIGCIDPFEKVNGSGIAKLRAAGVEVQVSVLEKEAIYVNRRFFTFHSHQRPYIILKWAQSVEHRIADDLPARTFISNRYTNILVHKWRSEESAILIGTNTALLDDPELTNRHWNGQSPLRVVFDRHLKLPATSRLLSDDVPVIIINSKRNDKTGNKIYHKTDDEDLIRVTLDLLHKRNILSVLVEGGAALLQSFSNKDLWDEARVITNPEAQIMKGKQAPVLRNAILAGATSVAGDELKYFVPE